MQLRTFTFLKSAVSIIGIVTLSLCIFVLPSLAGYTASMYPEFAFLKYPVLIGLYFSVVPFFFALYQSYNLLNVIKNKKAFSELAVMPLRNIMICAITITALYTIGIIILAFLNALHPGIAIIGIAIIFASLIIAIFSAVLQQLLRSVIILISENELTI
ncbi:DUF2975 domain-containing protein [Cytobacillus oceanisediminis]|uniref:DUF2975 domain-containing protein n=1 Tax=Cytobacillus oceanisediminis TaxID=665099 RepID=UPI00207A2278|nr:DUF2975 domain-containing protein [Cytobacillus oceanisediminis]USK42253.1 DUF2975 domain-containing protein [Cytobacillus oceanisediminis]